MMIMGHNMTNTEDMNLTPTQKTVIKIGKISKYWILLDSESTINIIKDAYLFTNIRTVKKVKR